MEHGDSLILGEAQVIGNRSYKIQESRQLVSRAEFFRDLKLAWSTVKEQGNQPQLIGLQQARTVKTALAFALDWAVITLAMWIGVTQSLWLLPLSLLLIGSRQRALSNLIHDASHGNLVKNRAVNDLVTNIFAALPMHDTVSSYQRFHGLHHANLGSLSGDPDAVTHLSYGFNDLDPWKGSIVRNFARLYFHPLAWRDSVVGGFLDLRRQERVQVLTWWTAVFALLVLAGGTSLALSCLGIWYLSRMTSYHGVRLFAEFLDHTGLKATSVIDFSRMLPHTGPWAWMFHPHQDTYHLVHHLAPNIPHYNLKAAANIFEKVPKIQSAHHCDAYFLFGKHKAINCLTGTCLTAH